MRQHFHGVLRYRYIGRPPPSSQNRFNILSSRPTKRHPRLWVSFCFSKWVAAAASSPEGRSGRGGEPDRRRWRKQGGHSLVPRSKCGERIASRRISGTANGSRRFKSCHLDHAGCPYRISSSCKSILLFYA